ncbi:MAG: hypothetical protein GXO07_03905 [Crenarchaeota archaeon]|nr:hypothetical protein [Thermoproteota archaeon]
MKAKWSVPLLFFALAAMAYVVRTVTLPNGLVATVTATVSVVDNTKYIIRTIVYDNVTVTDTITVVPMTGNLNAIAKKHGMGPLAQIMNQTMAMNRMRVMHNATAPMGPPWAENVTTPMGPGCPACPQQGATPGPKGYQHGRGR